MGAAEVDKHHVAWADRIGINKVWARNILDCNENFGLSGYPNSVDRLHNSLINIKNGPQLKMIVDEYKNKVLEDWKKKMKEEWKQRNPKYLSNHGRLKQLDNDINYDSMKMLYNYIVQTLEDNGFGFYESRDIPKGRDGYSQDFDYDIE